MFRLLREVARKPIQQLDVMMDTDHTFRDELEPSEKARTKRRDGKQGNKGKRVASKQ